MINNTKNTKKLILSTSPITKKILNISNITHKNQIPTHPNLYIIPPQINLYIKKNQKINNLYKKFITNKNHSIFNINKSFLNITTSLNYFHYKTTYKITQIIQKIIYNHVNIYITIKIKNNPLLTKLTLNNNTKHSPNFITK